MEFKKQAHAIYHTRYHIVMSTKYRRKVLKAGTGEYLERKVRQIQRFHPEIEIMEVTTDLDHMHLLVSIPPKIAVSQVVNMIKVNTAKSMRMKFPFLDKVYWGIEGIWSTGYCVSTAGLNEEAIKKYIKMQGKEDSGQAKLEW